MSETAPCDGCYLQTTTASSRSVLEYLEYFISLYFSVGYSAQYIGLWQHITPQRSLHFPQRAAWIPPLVALARGSCCKASLFNVYHAVQDPQIYIRTSKCNILILCHINMWLFMLIYFYLTGVVHISSKWAAEFVASPTVISKTRFDSWSHFLFFFPLLTALFFFFPFSMVHLLNVELETQLEFTQVYNVWLLNLWNDKNSFPNLPYLGCLFSW